MGSYPSPPPEEQAYSLADVPGKGKGLLATTTLSPGTLLISEPPLFTTESLTNPSTIEKDLGKLVRSHPKDSQRAFLSLHNNNAGPEPFTNIIRSNGYPPGPSSDIGGIFPAVARINHSCLPNAQHVYNPKIGRMQVHVLLPIASGDEITLSYTTGGPSDVMQRMLKDYFGFSCTCELCSLPSPKLAESDKRLRRARELDDCIGDPKRVRLNPLAALRDCHALYQIYQEERIRDLRLPRLFHDAFQICAMHSDFPRAKGFAQRSCEARILCEGEDHPNVEGERALVKRPEGFGNWGVTGMWREEKGEAVRREVVWYNRTPVIASLISGVCTSFNYGIGTGTRDLLKWTGIYTTDGSESEGWFTHIKNVVGWSSAASCGAALGKVINDYCADYPYDQPETAGGEAEDDVGNAFHVDSYAYYCSC
ncbi:hypothetical protein LTS10_009322 [Elasticomyces elasticus]|nr:hypothetical protein LTS10_009322 [Elasticomyces elasticus]